MSLLEQIEAMTRENLDSFLAGLDPEKRINVNEPCGCFLDQMWKAAAIVEGYSRVNVQIEYIGLEYGEDAGTVAFLPAWVSRWQERCIYAGAEVSVTPPEAREILAHIHEDEEVEDYE